MTHLLLTLVCGGGLSLLLTPVVRAIAGRYGLVDHPDRHRKIHPRSVPVAGGLVILGSASAALLALAVLVDGFREPFANAGFSLPGLFVAAAVICGTGVA